MANPNEPKVVPGGDVRFDSGSAPRADTLDGIVQPAGESRGSQGTDTSWIARDIQYLAEVVWPVLKITGGQWNQERLFKVEGYSPSPHVQGLLVQFITLDEEGNGSAKIRVGSADPVTLRPFLEEVYHPDIAASGIYQATGLDKDEPVSIQTLAPFFPEMESLSRLGGRYVQCVLNPYATLLTLPPRVRPLLAGAMREIKPPVKNEQSERFPQELTLKEILSYAKKVNELGNVATYMNVLKVLK